MPVKSSLATQSRQHTRSILKYNEGMLISYCAVNGLRCLVRPSPYCQAKKNVTVESIDHFDDDEECWHEAVLVDTRSSPSLDAVAFRCYFNDSATPFL